MKGKLSILGLVLIVSALIVSGCGPTKDQPTEDVEAPDEVRAARDAALAYISEQYGEQVPAPGLTWTEENITPGWPVAPVPGWIEYRFTAEDWVVTIGHVVLPPERIIYQVAVTNRTTGFQWKGEVDATEYVAERLAPDELRAARDAALAYILHNYGEEVAPAVGRTWTEERTTAGEIVGSETFEFTTGDWVVTVSYPVVAPEVVVYQVVVVNQTTGFQWKGEVDGTGQVTELYASTEPTLDIRDPGSALDIVLAYIRHHHGEQAPPADLTWVGDRPTPEEPIEGYTIRFTSESAPDWAVTVSYAVVAPEEVVFRIVVTNETMGFQWEGEVNAAGEVTETLAPTSGQPVVAWLSRVVSLPVDAQFDDYLAWSPKGPVRSA